MQLATPIGHAVAGMAIGAALSRGRPFLGPRADWALFALLAQAPDLDFLPGLFAEHIDAFHHGISHSLGFAVLCGALLALYGRRRGQAARWGLLGLSVYFAQVLLDALTQDARPPAGVPLWWPLSDAYVLIFPLFLNVWRTPVGWEMVRHDLVGLAWEMAWLAPPLLWAMWWRNQPPGGRDLEVHL